MKLQNIIFTQKGQEVLPCSSIAVSYESKEGSWRGFVIPYDLTYEADTKEEVMKVLQDMVLSYEDALKEYGSPSHLASVPLTVDEDINKFDKIRNDLISKIKSHKFTISSASYYAEAKLPA
jgi:hypothetical protein